MFVAFVGAYSEETLRDMVRMVVVVHRIRRSLVTAESRREEGAESQGTPF